MAKQISINYSLNTNNKWIYCNYPEQLKTDALADKSGYCLNRVEDVKDDGQIFYSYNAMELKNNFRFGVTVYNPNHSTVTLTRTNYGHSDSKNDGGWDAIPKVSWERFFKSTSKEFTIPAGKAIWICEEEIPAVCIFSGNLRFTTSAPVTISIFAFESKWDIPDDTKIYPYRFQDDAGNTVGKQYSGYGNGYFLTASEITIKLSDILHNDGIYFATNNQQNRMFTVNNGKTPDEIIPIYIAGTNYEVNVRNDKNGYFQNIANWCAQYFIPIKLINDIGGTHKVKCSIVSTSNPKKFPIVNCGGTISGTPLTAKGQAHVFKTVSVTDDLVFNYQFIFGTNSSGDVQHMFQLV